ncbi:unnamed protein product [Rotaria sordida]|uniref:Uncharacterized protein n=1 Tax=Rotaria sordida TaxID=392033 RepID=A0A818RKY7_9BILA|nr:unnamed protein product [Rotaria sordida]CAF1229549.1 unnamed protein product [Rotaria sordida]CAF1231825.1 unnamed protein product [Rotaria sordida]CAF3613365.1 unnamed protein product [Rotaria sordida]CAF3658910.1 unnamed protein product [Rotaria sordida]
MIIINPIACVLVEDNELAVTQSSELFAPIESLNNYNNNFASKQNDKPDVSDNDNNNNEDMDLNNIKENIMRINPQQKFKLDDQFQNPEFSSD